MTLGCGSLGRAGRGRRPVRLFACSQEFGIDPLSFAQLVFEDDDAAGGLEWSTPIDEFAGAGSDAELVAGVAPVTARGSHRGHQFRGVETAEKRLGDAEKLGGAAHAVCRVVVVVEFVFRAGGVRCDRDVLETFLV